MVIVWSYCHCQSSPSRGQEQRGVAPLSSSSISPGPGPDPGPDPREVDMRGVATSSSKYRSFNGLSRVINVSTLFSLYYHLSLGLSEYWNIGIGESARGLIGLENWKVGKLECRSLYCRGLNDEDREWLGNQSTTFVLVCHQGSTKRRSYLRPISSG